MLRDRLIFGPLMIAAMLGGLWLDGYLQGQRLGPWVLPGGLVILVVIAALIVPAARELRAVLAGGSQAASARVLAVSGIVGLAAVHVVPMLTAHHRGAWAGTGLAGVLGGAMVWHLRGREPRGAALAAARALLAAVYLGVLPGFYLAIRHAPAGGPWTVLALILVVKAADIGAYTTGRLVGKNKLIPWLSPGKTREGLVGGLVLAAAAAVALAGVARASGAQVWSEPGWTWWWLYAAGAGVTLGAVGQLGDLLASALKREAGIKDSGASIPGFGGILDVADSPILAAPVAYWVVVVAAGIG